MKSEIVHKQNTPASEIVLSLILCSRNDEYMGNSRWRLETTLNYVAMNVHALGREREVEVLVADWGSEIPLAEVLNLSPMAAALVGFIRILPELARVLQRDSLFPEVLALNTAVRRAKGQYIGRIDQDTLVGKRFLTVFFDIHEGRRHLAVRPQEALLFSNVRMIPYRFAVRCPSFSAVQRFVSWCGPWIKPENSRSRAPFHFAAVGIWLSHRSLWNECGGYDERMIFMNSMETDMIHRLMMRGYELVDLGRLVEQDFFHLEHYHPSVPRKSGLYRNVNRYDPLGKPDAFFPNGTNWGLEEYSLQVSAFCGRTDQNILMARPFEVPSFTLALLLIGTQMLGDSARKASSIWRRRAKLAWDAVKSEPIIKWPHLLKSLWDARNAQSVVYR
jgi:hypothetical protein